MESKTSFELLHAKERFLGHLSTMKRASPHTVRAYSIDIQFFLDFLVREKEGLGFISLNRRVLRRFVCHEHGRELGRRSLARRLSSLRSFCSFCVRESLIESDPMEAVASPKLDKRLPVFLEYSQIERFFQLPDTSTLLGLRDRAIMELFYSSGIRISELAAMNRCDIDKDELLIFIRGKGKKERLIPITPHALKWVTAYHQHSRRTCTVSGDEPVFLNSTGGRLTTRSIDRLFKRYLLKGGFSDRITPHVIRHTIATHWLEGGMDLKTIQELLGHTSLAATTIYTGVSSALKKATIENFHPRY